MPPGLLGAALLFWGWQTGFLAVAAGLALALEARHVMRWRWDLSRRDFNRVSDLCAVLLVVIAAYQFLGNEPALDHQPPRVATAHGLPSHLLPGLRRDGHGRRIDLLLVPAASRRRGALAAPHAGRSHISVLRPRRARRQRRQRPLGVLLRGPVCAHGMGAVAHAVHALRHHVVGGGGGGGGGARVRGSPGSRG